jgi:hypothetical protein
MIEVKLLVEDYCHNCPHFSPCAVDRRHYDEIHICNHEVCVTCQFAEHCGYLMNHLSKKDGGK